jgi:hypothetical protein
MVKKIEWGTKGGMASHAHRLEKSMLLKCLWPPQHKAIYRFDTIPTKTQMTFFTELAKKKILKLIKNHTKAWIAKATFSKKNTAGGITLPDFKQYKALVIKTTCWHKYRHIRQMEHTKVLKT